MPDRLRPFVRLFIALCLLPAALRAEKPFVFADTPGQLPKAVVPHHYTLRIQPDLDDRTTSGTVRIDFEVREPVTALVLNVTELSIDSAELSDDPAAPQVLTPTIDTAAHTLTLPIELAPGSHVLNLAFRGKIGTAAEGFFVDKYPTPSGEKLMLGTQFEPTDARRVFPCWDEPVYRATFDITLVVPKKLMAVSNMPVLRETALGPDLKEVTFARTPVHGHLPRRDVCRRIRNRRGRTGRRAAPHRHHRGQARVRRTRARIHQAHPRLL